MGDLADLTGAGDSTTLPGYTISPLTLADYGEMERAFESRHLGRAAAAASSLAPEAASLTVQKALDDVRGGLFTFGMPSFDHEATKWQSLPLLLWLQLRPNHKEATPEMAVQLIAKVPDRNALRNVILTNAGYRLGSKKKEPAPDGESTGTSSFEGSETKDNPPPTPGD